MVCRPACRQLNPLFSPALRRSAALRPQPSVPPLSASWRARARGFVPLVAQDSRATRISRGYIFEYLRQSPVLRTLIEDERANELDLSNRITIACFPCTKTALRGWSNPAGGLNELAFWRLEGAADSDVEVQASIRRGMLSFPSPRLIKISTPYMKAGVLHDDFRRAFGQADPDLLVWRAGSALMNPGLSGQRLERARRLDPSRYAREYEAEFSEDVDTFLPAVWVDEAVDTGRHDLAPRDGVRYVAAADPSGGGKDAFTLAIGHLEGSGVEACLVVDVVRGHRRVGSEAPDLSGIVADYAHLCALYRTATAFGDKYAGAWVRQAFQQVGISYRDTPADRSGCYLDLQPWFAQGRIALPDHAGFVRELKNLERRPRVGGKDVIDHPRSGSDDHANAVAILAAVATRRGRGVGAWVLTIGVPRTPIPEALAHLRARRTEARRAEWLRQS